MKSWILWLEKLCDYQTNPNIAVVGGFMCAETDEEAWQKADGWTFFQFALQLYAKEGPFEPGTNNFWERYQEWKRERRLTLRPSAGRTAQGTTTAGLTMRF